MSWLFSQALVEAFWGENSWAGEPFAQLNVMPTPHKFWRNDKTMEASNLSRFGLTLNLSTEQFGADLLMWFREDFLARTLALPGRAQASQAHAPECGLKWRASLAKFDPATHSWKTAQLSLLADSELSSVTWPRSGMTADGACWELPMLEPIISEIDSGLWPTPTASTGGIEPEGKTGRKLITVVNWPTPVASDTGSRKKPYAQGGTPLSLAANKWPTPTAHNAKETNAPSEANRNEPTLASRVGGHLNPTWVEWLMGWPLGWTDLKPLATARFHSAPQPRSDSLANGEAA